MNETNRSRCDHSAKLEQLELGVWRCTSCEVVLCETARQVGDTTFVHGPRSSGPMASHTVAESDPEAPDPPRAKRINYRCSRCGVAEASGELPPSGGGRLQMYPLPSGWMLIPCPVLEEDDHLHCAVCVENPPARKVK